MLDADGQDSIRKLNETEFATKVIGGDLYRLNYLTLLPLAMNHLDQPV